MQCSASDSLEVRFSPFEKKGSFSLPLGYRYIIDLRFLFDMNQMGLNLDRPLPTATLASYLLQPFILDHTPTLINNAQPQLRAQFYLC